ncbi:MULTISPECIES: hypothetical protein [Mesorhizobium]|uniref:hypothetical protein n=1 Tax=Mesorhizobium TaxID=68287 RepID=UPI0023EA6B93|nr:MULTISPECIES: hypothetical protein [Mesorhizobium]
MLYLRVLRLSEGLAFARIDGRCRRLIYKLTRVRLLILDDFGTHSLLGSSTSICSNSSRNAIGANHPDHRLWPDGIIAELNIRGRGHSRQARSERPPQRSSAKAKPLRLLVRVAASLCQSAASIHFPCILVNKCPPTKHHVVRCLQCLPVTFRPSLWRI